MSKTSPSGVKIVTPSEKPSRRFRYICSSRLRASWRGKGSRCSWKKSARPTSVGERETCRRLLVTGEAYSTVIGSLNSLVERRAHQLRSAAPQGHATHLLFCGFGYGLRPRIGIYNGIAVIDNKQGIRKRLKHMYERLIGRISDAAGLLCSRHSAVTIPFTYTHPGNGDAFLLISQIAS